MFAFSCLMNFIKVISVNSCLHTHELNTTYEHSTIIHHSCAMLYRTHHQMFLFDHLQSTNICFLIMIYIHLSFILGTEA